MSTESRKWRRENAQPRTAVGAIVAVVAGFSSRWLLVDQPLLALAVIAVAAVVLVLATPRVPLLIIVACVMVSAIAVQIPGLNAENLALGAVAGLLTSLFLAGPLTMAAVLRHRRDFHRRGWRLAAMEAQTRSRDIQAVLQRERMSLAAEMHDGLGHSLTLIAVRLGQLSLQPTLAPADRAAVSELRESAAEAADELGIAVRLLRDPGAIAAASVAPAVMDSVASARSAGISVTADVPDGLSAMLSAEAQAAVSRLVQESLTNAAKHAPGEAVDVSVRLVGSTVVAEVSNGLSAHSAAGPSSADGFGLVGLRHRAAMLGGSLEVRRSPDAFALTLALPVDAKPLPTGGAADGTYIAAAESEAAQRRAKATRTAIVLPAAILAAVLAVTAGYLALATTSSVMGPHRFAQIQPGDPRAEVELSLPLLELLDPPRDEFPAGNSEHCRYYESTVSFFERGDVHVICFDDDVVTRTGVVPAP